MVVVARKRKKKKSKISYKKVAFTIIVFAGLIISVPVVWRSATNLYKYGVNGLTLNQHDNILNFGVALPSGYRIHGIDISHHQKIINWPDVATIDVNGNKINFAFIKATEGITRQDGNFSKNWKKCREAGLIRGAYHFYYPTRDALKQAENFIQQVTLQPGDLPPVLDIELSKGKSKAEIVEGCKVWCNAIELHYGVKPIFYTNPTFYDRYLKDDFEDYPLWIAHYYKEVPKMHHREWIFWQHTDCACIKGIDKPVDLNVFKGDMDDLLELCIK
ncbi:MAG TPA: glycoside hydrolase family 25 protein [Lentimicrobium sp.]|nr:glycoside hydrolase family 25 protein [Lentimicrobium sp.]